MTRIKQILSTWSARREAATKGPWFVAGLPWDRRDTAVYGDRRLRFGHNYDPHAARLITDCDVTDQWIEDEPDGSIEDRNNAAFIAHSKSEHARLTKALERAVEALQTIADGKLAGSFSRGPTEVMLVAHQTIAEIEKILEGEGE
jgi:hypothetical protein